LVGPGFAVGRVCKRFSDRRIRLKYFRGEHAFKLKPLASQETAFPPGGAFCKPLIVP
jgi:hypothetical protein